MVFSGASSWSGRFGAGDRLVRRGVVVDALGVCTRSFLSEPLPDHAKGVLEDLFAG
jgi:hypothetical protein